MKRRDAGLRPATSASSCASNFADSATELFPTQIRGTAVGAAFRLGSAGGVLAPAMVDWVATSHSIATALLLLALSFFLIIPMFLFVARETMRRELADFVGQRARQRALRVINGRS